MNLIFDIGANVGQFTNKCLEIYPNCKIIDVEPNPELFEILKKKFESKNVIVIDEVISSKSNEQIEFYISKVNTISTASIDWIKNSRFSKKFSWNKPIIKNTLNLDDLISKFGSPDLIKIDVEGYELEVIKGLSSKQKEICFEWTEENYENLNKICDHLEKIGYKDFGFIYKDEYMKKPEIFSSWIDCEIHNDIDINRKKKWGIIWVK